MRADELADYFRDHQSTRLLWPRKALREALDLAAEMLMDCHDCAYCNRVRAEREAAKMPVCSICGFALTYTHVMCNSAADDNSESDPSTTSHA